jgi:hypothetical protein
MKFLIPFIFLFLVCSISGVSQDNTFTFKGKVYFSTKPLKGATIEVYGSGDLIYETTSKGSGKFQFDLKSEKQYMVEVSMENMRLKTIWINTKRTKDVDVKIPVFAFDVYLEEEAITPYDELSELPVTLVKYQVKKKVFYMDKAYTQVIKSKKKEIKQNTFLIRR